MAFEGDKAVVCFPFKGSTLGGSHISTALLVKELQLSAFQPLVVLHEADGVLARYLRENNIPFAHLPVPFYPSGLGMINPREWVGTWRTVLTARRFLKRHNVRIVHTNDRGMHILWTLAAKLSGVKVLHYQRSLLKKFDGTCRVIFAMTDKVVCNSSYVRDAFPAPLSPDDVIDLPVRETDRSALDAAGFKSRYGLPDGRRHIGFLANLREQKNPELFVELARMISGMDDRTDIYFLIGGEAYGNYANNILERIDQYGLRYRIRYIGPVDDPYAFLAACDVYVAPARNEGVGRTLLEAMMVGTPVVASREGGHIGATEGGVHGILVAPDDAAAYAQAVLRLLDDAALRTDLCVAARAYVIDTFGVQKHTRGMTDIYAELLRP